MTMYSNKIDRNDQSKKTLYIIGEVTYNWNPTNSAVG